MGAYRGLSRVFWRAPEASEGILSEGHAEEEPCVRGGGLQPWRKKRPEEPLPGASGGSAALRTP